MFKQELYNQKTIRSPEYYFKPVENYTMKSMIRNNIDSIRRYNYCNLQLLLTE